MAQHKKPVLRRCVGCGEMKDKKDLIRIVRTQSGEIVQDPTGRMNGRGAYICRCGDCVSLAARNRGLERSLKCRIDGNIWEQITEKS